MPLRSLAGWTPPQGPLGKSKRLPVHRAGARLGDFRRFAQWVARSSAVASVGVMNTARNRPRGKVHQALGNGVLTDLDRTPVERGRHHRSADARLGRDNKPAKQGVAEKHRQLDKP